MSDDITSKPFMRPRNSFRPASLKDVAEAGGWLDTRSLENCYQQVDEETLLRVVSGPRKLRETIPPLAGK